MKIEVGKTYKTRDGGSVRIVAELVTDSYYPFVGLVMEEGATSEYAETYTATGEEVKGMTSGSDIINIVETYLHVYNGGNGLGGYTQRTNGVMGYASKDDADSSAGRVDRTGYLKLTYMDGKLTKADVLPL